MVLVGWPASDQGIQCEWSIQHLFHSLKKLTPGGDDDTLQLSDLSHLEIQRRARSLNENLNRYQHRNYVVFCLFW